MPISDETLQALQIFQPSAVENYERVTNEQRRFVHYTTASNAMSIIQNSEFWMRKTSCMNDWTEVDHGRECVVAAYKVFEGPFKDSVDSIYPGLSEAVKNRVNEWLPYFDSDTYIFCLSEHLDDEDESGRLSMWRAYGNTTGAALVINRDSFLTDTDVLKTYSSPVSYLQDYEVEFGRVITNIKSNVDFLKSIGRDTMFGMIFNMFRFAVLCTKHPGFREEREWRLIHTPPLDKSPHLVREIYSINDVPQPVYKIPLRNHPNDGLTGIEIPELIERIIIGPTQYPSAIYAAFKDLLEQAGVSNPEEKVHFSNIPLRT